MNRSKRSTLFPSSILILRSSRKAIVIRRRVFSRRLKRKEGAVSSNARRRRTVLRSQQHGAHFARWMAREHAVVVVRRRATQQTTMRTERLEHVRCLCLRRRTQSCALCLCDDDISADVGGGGRRLFHTHSLARCELQLALHCTGRSWPQATTSSSRKPRWSRNYANTDTTETDTTSTQQCDNFFAHLLLSCLRRHCSSRPRRRIHCIISLLEISWIPILTKTTKVKIRKSSNSNIDHHRLVHKNNNNNNRNNYQHAQQPIRG